MTIAKAVKNETELEGMRACHIRDGVAQIEYFAWLEEQLLSGKELDECQAADQLEAFRKYVNETPFSCTPDISQFCDDSANLVVFENKLKVDVSN